MKAAIEVIAVTDSYVLIKDECEKRNTMSITNDAEGVVAYIAGQFDLSKRRLFYIDTEGLTDELLVRDSTFAGFKPGHEGVIL
jgi:hypothetical protein